LWFSGLLPVSLSDKSSKQEIENATFKIQSVALTNLGILDFVETSIDLGLRGNYTETLAKQL